ncbi:MAG: hypothetical protein AAFQ98_21500, partial [Bacteroidota bacterium]
MVGRVGILAAQGLCQAGLPMHADTLVQDRNHTQLAYIVGEDTLKIRRLNDELVFPLDDFRRLEKDSTWVPTPEKRAWFDSTMHQMAQNCFSYAFEWSFIELTNGPNPWFNEETTVLGPSTEWLLGYAYDQVSVNRTLWLRCAQKRLPNKAYLLFRDQQGKPVHAAYYLDGIFYSKNGAKPPMGTLQLRELVKHYPFTHRIEVYQLK